MLLSGATYQEHSLHFFSSNVQSIYTAVYFAEAIPFKYLAHAQGYAWESNLPLQGQLQP